MSRRILAVVAAASVLAACKSAPPATTTDAPAGTVLSVAGTVTARRAQQHDPRRLAADSAVFADDTVTTGSSGNVQIRLSRNHALWTLGPDQSRRVDSSIAWSAPETRGSDPLLGPAEGKDETHSAGRHGEHEGVSSGEAAIRGDDVDLGKIGTKGYGPGKKDAAGAPRGGTKAEVVPVRDVPKGTSDELAAVNAKAQAEAEARAKAEEERAAAEQKKESEARGLLGALRDSGSSGSLHDVFGDGSSDSGDGHSALESDSGLQRLGSGGGGSGEHRGDGEGIGGGGSAHVGGSGDSGGEEPQATPTSTARKVIRLEDLAVMGREKHQSVVVTETVIDPSLDAKAIEGTIDFELDDAVNACFDPPWGIEPPSDHTTAGIILNVTTAGKASVGAVRWDGAPVVRDCLQSRLSHWSIAPKGSAGRVVIELEIVKLPPPPDRRPIEAK